jgi:hypothetical protein
MSFIVVVCGRNRREPRVEHERIEAAILECQRIRLLENNLDRQTWVAQIVATFPAEIPKVESARGIRE